MQNELVLKLREIVGEDFVLTDRALMEGYLTDVTALPVRPKPASDIVVVKPANAQEISSVLKLANQHLIPVIARGGGTGCVGAAVPTVAGIVLSLERLDRIIEVDKDNLMVVAEAGATLEKMLKEVEAAGLLFPPHPGDEGAQLGGLVVCNAGGTRAVKYGVVRQYVKGLVSRIHVHVRRFEIDSLPESADDLRQWLFDRWKEKDELLEQFYATGAFPAKSIKESSS